MTTDHFQVRRCWHGVSKLTCTDHGEVRHLGDGEMERQEKVAESTLYYDRYEFITVMIPHLPGEGC